MRKVVFRFNPLALPHYLRQRPTRAFALQMVTGLAGLLAADTVPLALLTTIDALDLECLPRLSFAYRAMGSPMILAPSFSRQFIRTLHAEHIADSIALGGVRNWGVILKPSQTIVTGVIITVEAGGPNV